MVRVGLTGGIASGKTAVSDLLGDRGAVIIDADLLAREVVAPGTDGLAAVVRRFGPTVLTGDRVLDRAALGTIVFADPAARADLEAIIHPLVRRRAGELTVQAEADAAEVVVQVIPLLVETRQQHGFDCCVVIDLEPSSQRDRLVRRSGLTVAQAQQRIDAQASRADRLAAATWVIDSSGPAAGLGDQVDRLWHHLVDGHAPHNAPHDTAGGPRTELSR